MLQCRSDSIVIIESLLLQNFMSIHREFRDWNAVGMEYCTRQILAEFLNFMDILQIC